MTTTINPVVHYRDLAAGAKFLVDSFGFVQHQAHADDDGKIQYVELSLNGAPLGLGPFTEGSMFDTGPAVVYISLDEVDTMHAACRRRWRRGAHGSHRPGLRLTRLRGEGSRGQRVVLRHLPTRCAD